MENLGVHMHKAEGYYAYMQLYVFYFRRIVKILTFHVTHNRVPNHNIYHFLLPGDPIIISLGIYSVPDRRLSEISWRFTRKSECVCCVCEWRMAYWEYYMYSTYPGEYAYGVSV